jgi:hypothetical protein
MKTLFLKTKQDTASERGKGKALRAKRNRVGVNLRTCKVAFIKSWSQGTKSVTI